MNVPVLAQSISALGSLLANPPQYPRNPTHEVRDPLVLYIVRVPGSKDVFLTPLKPPTKSSISLEAIQSSLYYFHVASREDEQVKRSIDEQRQSEEVARVIPTIHRKPLPAVPHSNYPPSGRPLPPPKSYPAYQPGLFGEIDATQVERFAARGSHINFINQIESQDQGIRRHSRSPKKLQPAPDSHSRHQEDLKSHKEPYESHADQSPHSAQYSGHGSHVPQQWQPDISLNHPIDSSALHVAQGVLSNHNIEKHAFGSVGITMIRRDPTSGSQWNVGSILVGENDGSNMPLNPTLIEISTPGYSRFASTPEAPRPETGYSNAESIKQALASGRLEGFESNEADGKTQPFTRVAEYQQHCVDSRSLKLHRRTDSTNSVAKPGSPTKRPRQVYSFSSPWQGLCTFNNSIDGRSLKCRHTLWTSNFTDEDTTATVAELRFNLPRFVPFRTADKLSDDDTLPIPKLLGPRSGKDSVKRRFQNFKDHMHERSSSNDDQPPVLRDRPPQLRLEPDLDRLSLKLGREKAGGGFKGTSAKLGKLIIEDEGLKMCDLVVAACMGVWWQHYDERDD